MAKNAQNKVPRNDMRKEIADTMRRIYGQETIEQASGCSANGAEQNDEWINGKVYLNPKAMEKPKK